MGKKTDKKIDNIKEIFEASNINITEDQLKAFTKAFELLSESKLNSKIQPLKEKVEVYSKRNHELNVKLEESKSFKPLLEQQSNKLNEVLQEKIDKINNIKIPKSDDVVKLVEKKLTSVTKKMKSDLSTLKETVGTLKKEIETFKNLKISEDVENLGKTFSKYKVDFVDAITVKESTKINELEEALVVIKEELKSKTEAVNELTKSLKEEKELSEFATIIESANPDDAERDYLMGFYNKMEFNEAKEAVAQFIQMKESKMEKMTKETPKMKFVMKENGIKKKSHLGIIKERKNEHKTDMENWVTLANI